MCKQRRFADLKACLTALLQHQLSGIQGPQKQSIKIKKSVYVVSGTPQSSCGYRKRPTVGLVYLRDRELYVRYKTYLLRAF